MKSYRIFALLLALCLCTSGLALAADDDLTTIKGTLTSPVKLQKSYPDNPVVEGFSSTTGLPSSGETYTPIIVDLDGGAYPHWGIADADIVFQVPNQGLGSTKLLALFADHYPEECGGSRSARASMVPIVVAWDAAFAYADIAPVEGNNVNVDTLARKWGLRLKGDTYKCFSLLSSNLSWRVRKEDVPTPGNLSCYVRNIHNELIEKNVAFEERPLRFANEPRTDGQSATYIKILHRGDSADKAVNATSTATYEYSEEAGGYLRFYHSGDADADRYTGEAPVYTNVIVMRIQNKWQNNYLYLKNHMVGSGCAEIFQNGRYVQGAWYRESETSRLVFIGPDGNELEFQRGKTFIVVGNDVTEVKYR
ncbi:MAG: DUF3048 C-terminal domain-containing protein [Clostridia bacterium]|nr:DUF3048 C-terminal domain-containing protein [Clostridia bacterium]